MLTRSSLVTPRTRRRGDAFANLRGASVAAQQPSRCLARPWPAGRGIGRRGQMSRKPLDVPFPGRRQNLIKIINVENDVAFGRGEPPKFQMAIAARLHRYSGVWRGTRSVHTAEAPVEGKRRLQHAPVSDGNEFLDSLRICGQQDVDRVGVFRSPSISRDWRAECGCEGSSRLRRADQKRQHA